MRIGVRFTDWDTAVVIARLGDITVEKTAKLAGCALAVCRDEEDQQYALWSEITRKCREADRDIAYKLHGQNFREHCLFQSNFWSKMTEEEMAHVDL